MTRILTTIVVLVSLSDAAYAQPPRPPATAAPVASSPSDRSVTMTLAEYNRLIDLASRSTPPSSLAPVAATLASAELRVRVDRDAARGVFTLAGDVLRPGIHRVPLISTATLTDANIDGRPLPLLSEANLHSALLPGPAPFNVTLEWGTALTLAPGRAMFQLPVPPAGAARATIDVPGEQADVRVSAGVVTRRTAAGGRTLVDVTLKPGAPVDVWWSMRDSAPVAAAREVRMLADVFTLVALGDSDIRMAALVDVAVVQGEPRTLAVRLPAGYELSGISGSAIEASEPRDNGVVLTVTDPSLRRLQFLVTLERAHAGGSFKAETDFIALPDVQRERGEVAIEGAGTLDLEAAEGPGMHRIDVREVNGSLQSLARSPLLAAFRYQRSASTRAGLALNVQRFPDAAVLAAVADRATATTMITAEGRALTEVTLHLRNRAQPFLKLALPSGASIVSVDVAGETAKPVLGADGARVPLLRPGFRPSGPYQVSFVYLHAGTPFAKKGELPMALPRMDIPIGVVEWEMFVPDSYKAEPIDGNVIKRALVDQERLAGGHDTDIASLEERVMTSSARRVDSANAPPPPSAAPDPAPPSQNVLNLQKRAAGVLPIRIDVPRAGTSHQFIKPLVVDQEATVTLRYRRR